MVEKWRLETWLALFGAAGVGISFMEPRAFWLGAAICAFTTIYTARHHWREVENYLNKLRKKHSRRPPFPKGMLPALALIAFCIGAPAFLYFARPVPVLNYGTLSNSWYEAAFAPLTRYPSIQIGEGGATVVFVGRPSGDVFKFIDGYSLIVEIICGRIKVSTQVANQNGDVIAALTRNEWKTRTTLLFDRNYNDSSLEVIGSDGKVVLQVTVRPDRVILQGEWRSKTDKVRLVATKNPITGNIESMMLGRPNGFLPNDPEIKAMFKYPSDLHLGELVDQN
jgi:hypothetical protein